MTTLTKLTKFDPVLEGFLDAMKQATVRFNATPENINYASAISVLVDAYSRLLAARTVEELGVSIRLAADDGNRSEDADLGRILDKTFSRN